jgi:AraC-like DNA-binding protein
MGPAVFSTVGLPAARRVELWEDHNAAALIGLVCRPIGGDALAATELNVRLGDLHLARVAGSAHAVERTPKVITASPADGIAVYVTLRGAATFSHAGETRALRPGHVVIHDADQPFARGFARGLEEVAIKVPRAALTDPPRSPVVVDLGRDQHARALAGLVGRATRWTNPVPADERTLLDLVTLLTGGDTDPLVAHRAAARSFIEAHLTDRGLTAPVVAAAVGISARHLSRVFAEDGTTLPRHILSRRLQLAHAVLSGGADSVTDVAARCGFTSATYFSHVFHQHFGVRAGDVRRELRISAITAQDAGQEPQPG